MGTFAPLGDSVVVAVTETDQRVALPTLPASNPFIRLVAAQGNMLALYVKLGNGAVTGSIATSTRVRPGSIADPLYIFVGNSETHLSIFCEGPPGNVTITAGKFFDSDPASGFAPRGDSTAIAVTDTDQRVALPTLPASNPIIRLVTKQPNIVALYVKLGDAAVTGSIATSMRIVPGSVDEPIYIGVGAGETHLSIFCEGPPGTVVLTGGKFGSGELPAGTISYAQIQNVSASPRLLGRKTAGAGVIEEITLSEALDFIGSAAQGDILFRGAAAWQRLAASTSGRFLKTLGAGADPAWAAVPTPYTPISEAAFSGVSTLDFALGSADMYELEIMSLQVSSDGTDLNARLSQAASFLTGAGNYGWTKTRYGSGSDSGGAATLISLVSTVDADAAAFTNIRFQIYRPSVASFRKMVLWAGGITPGNASAQCATFSGAGDVRLNSNAVDGFRILPAGGTISGRYAFRSISFT